MTFLSLWPLLLAATAPEPALRLTPTADGSRLEVIATLTGKPAAEVPPGKLTQDQGERWLRLTLAGPDRDEAPAVLGTYERRQDRLIFLPRYPLVAGQRYQATLVLGEGRQMTAEGQLPARKPAAPAVVEKIFPTAEELPANQLKFYVHFWKEMREGRDVFEHFHLLETDGQPVAEPWRRTELWSADGKRLTLLIHPGRIKQGVNLRLEEGPVLRPGRTYRLVIDADLLDGDGNRLGREFTKTFRTLPEKHTQPRVEDWKLSPPAAGARQPLVVRFPEPLDRALLDRFVDVLGPDGKPLAGHVEVGPGETSWQFHPEQAWQAAEYVLRADEQLEDLAGNTPARPFDVDLTQPAPAAPKLTVSFRPATASR